MRQNDLLQLIVKHSPTLFGAYERTGRLIAPEVSQDVARSVYYFIQESSVNLGIKDPTTVARQIAPKTLGFCGLVALGYGYTSIANLMPFMNVISTMYLLDQTIDNSPHPQRYKPIIDDLVLGTNRTGSPLVTMVEDQIDQFEPNYRNLIRQLSFRDIILNQYELRCASIRYFNQIQSGARPVDLLNERSVRILTHNLVTNVGLQLVATGAYLMLYKYKHVSTAFPPITRDATSLIRVLEGFLRACDDYGDRQTDLDEHPNLNVFNQPILLRGLGQLCGIDINENTPPIDVLKQFYIKSKEELSKLKVTDYDNDVFINLLLRVMEGGIVNILGDRNLEDGSDITPQDANNILYNLERGLEEKNEQKV